MKSCTSSGARKRSPERVYTQLLNSLCIDLSIPEALMKQVVGLARARMYSRLVSIADELSSQLYESAAEHRRYHQLASFIKKVPFVDPGLNPRAAALASFRAEERRMSRVNAKFRVLWERLNGRGTGDIPDAGKFLLRVRAEVHKILGPLSLESVYGRCYFGDGSSVGNRGQRTHIVEKVRNLSATRAAIPYACAAFQSNWTLRRLAQGGEFSPFVQSQSSRIELWMQEHVTVVNGSQVDFVPKNAKTHRAITLVPSLNCFLQLGAGLEIAEKLRRYGCDITDQSKNQAYARYGSNSGDGPAVSTLDLKNASKTLCTGLCRFVLPDDWWSFLSSIRCADYEIEGVWTRVEEFASMGNGFCFPLQSLIYLAIVRVALRVTGDTLHTVYGDDIIVPQSTALLVIEYLRYCGFRVNTDKSFVFGPFRESCGADFYNGENVRPYVLDIWPRFDVDLVKIGNGVSRVFGFGALARTCYDLIEPHRRYVKNLLTEVSDDALYVPQDLFLVSPHVRWDKDRHTWNYKVFRSQSASDVQLLTVYEQLLALNHGSTPLKIRQDRKVVPVADKGERSPFEGQPSLPLRFTARYSGQWFMPSLRNLVAAEQRLAALWQREDEPESPVA